MQLRTSIVITTIARTESARRHLALAALLAGAFLWAYYATFRKLVDYWNANDTYSYGFLVPAIIGYLIWRQRGQLQAVPTAPSFGWGTVVLATGLAMLTIGGASNTNLLEELSIPVTVTGLVLLVFGWRMTRALAFPLAYMLMMIPFWSFITDPLQAPFQLYSATIGVAALRLFDLAVFRDGVLIYLPETTLEVADVCSGVNQLVAILCIGVPLAYLNISQWSKRLIIVAASLVIAILSNGLRVAMIGLFAYYGIKGPNGDVHGPYSMGRTTLISAIGFLILFWLIGFFSDRPAEGEDKDHSHRRLWLTHAGLSATAVAVAVALLVGTAAFNRWRETPPVPLSAGFAAFPRVVAGWHDAGEKPLSAAVSAVRFDSTLSRRYVSSDGSEVAVLVGYFERQTPVQELAGFTLTRLLSPRETPGTQTLKGNVRVTDFVTTMDGERYHVTYWYVMNGRIMSGSYETKWWSTWNALTRRRSNGGVVIVTTKVDEKHPIDTVRSTTQSFLDGIVEISSRLLSS